MVCLTVCPCNNCSTAEMKVQLRGFIGFSTCFHGFTFMDLENKASFSDMAGFVHLERIFRPVCHIV